MKQKDSGLAYLELSLCDIFLDMIYPKPEQWITSANKKKDNFDGMLLYDKLLALYTT